MENLQIILAIFELILFGIFFALFNYIFYLLTFKDGYKSPLTKIFIMLVFGGMDALAIYIIINISNF